MKNKQVVLIEDLFLGDVKIAYDGYFLETNKITHIVNTNSLDILNIFDLSRVHDPKVEQVLLKENEMGSAVMGKVKYLDIPNWTEHILKKID